MTTFDERLRALGWGRQLLEELVAAPEDLPENELASLLLPHYPTSAEIEVRLERCGGYALLLAVRAFDRTAGLLERLTLEAGVGLRDRTVRIARHFPEREELGLAVRSPYEARAWAVMYLDRAPGRSAFLQCDLPEPSAPRVANKRQRRAALRQLATALRCLHRDPGLTVFASGQVWQTLRAMPDRRTLSRRFEGEDLRALNAHMRVLQQACQIIEAVADGTFTPTRRAQASVLRLHPRLPKGDWFALGAIGEGDRQAWVDELFLRRPRRQSRGAA